MKMAVNRTRLLNSFFISVLLLPIVTCNLFAQQIFGISAGYEVFPFASLADPPPEAQDLEIETTSWSAGAAFPFDFTNGKFMILNQFNYKRVDFNYHNFPDNDPDIDQAQSIEYTAFLIDSLSPQWKMVAILSPGFASDFEAQLSSDDFTFQGAFGFIRRFNENFSFGFGAAYIRDFGPPLPLPFLYFDWDKSENLSVTGIVPNNLDVIYVLNPRIDLGLSFKVSGNRYHGNPSKFDDQQGNPIKNPQMEYSEGTISPTVQMHFLEWLHLNIEGGFAFYRNFRFLDGDEEEESFDLEKTSYLRVGIILGV
jgi:hypothetical protein